jgi:hypothetical protein
MKRCLLVLLTTLGLGWSAAPAHAFGWDWVCCPTYYVTYEQRVVTCYRPQWYADKVPCLVPKVSYRETVTPVQYYEYVPRWYDDQQAYVHYTPVPRVVQQDVVTCRLVPEVLFDPCTFCCYVSCRVEPSVTRVQSVVYDYKPEVKYQPVKLCKYEPVERVYQHRSYVPVVTQEPSWALSYRCEMVPYQATVSVPVIVPCPTYVFAGLH